MADFQKIVKNILEKLENILRAILSYPLELVANISRVLKFSIRSKITVTYLALYTWITIFTALVVLGGYFYYNIQKDTSREYKVLQDIQVMIQEHEEEDLGKAIEEIELTGVEVLVQNPFKDTVAVTTDSDPVNHYEEIKNSHRIYKTLPQLGLLSYALYPRVSNYEGYDIIFFYDVRVYLMNMLIMTLCMAFSYLIGVFLLWVIGSSKTKKVLKPIKQFTKSAQSINGKNLSVRIDVGEAKYELKDLALTINGMMDRIQDSYVKQQEFVSDVSHELRTPISVINGYANMLDRWGKDNPEILQESIDALKNEASNMGDLVEKLLFLARYDGNRIQYAMKSIDLSEIVEEIANETELIDTKHPIIREVARPLMILGDYNRLKQVIRIFTDNALKYTPEGGSIHIRAYREGNMTVVSIKDTGIGISKKDLENIFNRFYRTDKSRTKNTGGYGLGLSIAKIIVLQHNGKIIVRSKVGVGSEFRIHIPIG